MIFGRKLRVTLFLVLWLSPVVYSQEFTYFGGFPNAQPIMIRMPSTQQPVQLKSTPQSQTGDSEQASILINEADAIISQLLQQRDELLAENQALRERVRTLESENSDLRILVSDANVIMSDQADNRNDWYDLYQKQCSTLKLSRTWNYILSGVVIVLGGIITFNYCVQ